MKLKIEVFLAVLGAMAPIANAFIVNVEVGDRPYYSWAGLLRRSPLLGLDSGALELTTVPRSFGLRLTPVKAAAYSAR
jgi:hypothetical protein